MYLGMVYICILLNEQQLPERPVTGRQENMYSSCDL